MSAIRSAVNSLSGTIINLLIGLVGMILLARLVPIEDHGIYALSYAIYLIFQPFLDFGLTPVYIKLSKVEKHTNSVFFAFNVYVGLAIASMMVILSPLVASFFNNPVLVYLLLIQGLSVVLISAGNQPVSQLFREKKFLLAEGVRNISALLALAIAVILALNGWGIWALAAKFFLNGAFRFIASWIIVRPSYRWVSIAQLKKYRSSFRFGGYITASRIVAGYTNNLDKLFIGKLFGDQTLGHYEKAVVIADKPNTLRNALSTPAVSHLARMPRSAYAEHYFLLIHLFSLVAGCPALFFCSMARN